MPIFSRRELFIGAASGATGVIAGAFAYRFRRSLRGERSYADAGEDLIADSILKDPRWWRNKVGDSPKPSYLDIGAFHPIQGNNTYLFYRNGGRGVLVEPNLDLITNMKATRPGDTVLNVGVGVTAQKEADYYCYQNSALNTFDKDLVERRIATGDRKYTKVVKMPLVPINQIIEENLHGMAPDFLSTDVEGLDLAILKTLDFQRFRPKVICAETIDEDLTKGLQTMDPEITRFLSDKGYMARGMTFYNTLYIDTQQFRGNATPGEGQQAGKEG